MQATRAGLLGLILALSMAGTAFGQTRYISDELVVPLRSGPSIRNSITRNLRAGTAVEVLEQERESGYSRVRVPDRGTEGWLETQYLAPEPIARDRLVAVEQALETARSRAAELEGRVAALTGELERAQRQLEATRESSGELSEELEDVRAASANVLAIREENERLERDLARRAREIEALTAENSALANRERQNWFVVGASVLTGGIVLGLVLPSLRRRRREW